MGRWQGTVEVYDGWVWHKTNVMVEAAGSPDAVGQAVKQAFAARRGRGRLRRVEGFRVMLFRVRRPRRRPRKVGLEGPGEARQAGANEQRSRRGARSLPAGLILLLLQACATAEPIITLPFDCSIPRFEIVEYHGKVLHVASWFCPRAILSPQQGGPLP